MLEAEDMATDRIARDSANRAFGLTDTIAGAGGAGIGAAISDDPKEGLVYGALAAAANKAGRAYGNPLMATGFNKLSKSLLNSPRFAELAAKNQPAFQSLVQNLLNQPAFRKGEPQAPPIEQDPRVLEFLTNNPDAIDRIQNPKLKEIMRKRVNQSPESNVDAQKSFIEGN
jgi:hypothetical protein